MEFGFKVTPSQSLEEAKSNLLGAATSQMANNEIFATIIDQYCHFFDSDQNKEVLHMGLENCSNIILKMQNADESQIDAQAAQYFN